MIGLRITNDRSRRSWIRL